MSKFHINDDGVVGKCSAQPGNCEFGDDFEHFKDPSEARAYYELKNQDKTLKNFSKSKTNKTTTISKPISALIENKELRENLENPELTSLINKKHELQEKFDELDALENPTFDDYNKMVKISDQQGVIKKQIEELKDINAELANKVFPEPIEHEVQTPANFKEVATFESGTSEWLKARQGSLGGSDAGAFVFADDKYGANNFYNVRNSKLDLNPENQEHTGAARRGDLWEPALVELASKELGEQVYVNKSTFKEINPDGTEGYRHVNLDGFTVNEDGSLKAIVECKTSSKPEAWEDGKIPAGYVLQTQHYMDCLNVDKAYIAVNIDDKDFKLIEVTPDTKVARTESANKRKDLDLDEEYTYRDIKDLAVGRVKDLNIKREQIRNGIVKPQRKPVRHNWKKTWGDVVKNDKKLAFIDLETSTFSEKRGHVLEVAAFKEDDNGSLVKFHKFYGVPKEHEEWNGTGATDVHHISPDDVRGLKPFREDKEAQAELKAFLTDKDGSMLTGVAHNAAYEKKHFIGSMGIEGMEWVDTMHAYSGLGNEDRPNNKLESLVEESGANYEDAHHADADALMMYDAYKGYLLPKMKKELENE